MHVTLVSSDGQSFEVDEAILKHCETLQGDFIPSEPFPIPNVDGRILKLVIDWLTQHKDDVVVAPEDARPRFGLTDYPEWDQAFIAATDKDTLFELVIASNYLLIKGLLAISCEKIADQLKSLTPAEIRQTFNIKNDLTPEEEEQIRMANAWTEE